jgi:hypothetical protein
MASWQWAQTWKRAAKHHRAINARLLGLFEQNTIELTKWRRRALEAEALVRDYERDSLRVHLASVGKAYLVKPLAVVEEADD